MDLHKWLRMFEIDPELEPPELELVLPDADGWSWRIAGQLMGDSGCISDEVAAALIRDRAVIVGGEKWRFNLVWAGRTYRDDRPDGWQVYYKQKLLVQKPDPLEALYFAWCKVLGAEP